MSTPEISIIVPVYNSEKYLRRCIDSILSQTFDDFELILVDDGSTDSSGEICDIYALQDDRVSVIHQQNSGASAARNTGIDAAAGQYIGFIDADDYVEPDMIEALHKISYSSIYDMILFDPIVHNDSTDDIFIDSMHFYSESIAICKNDITPYKLRFMAGTVWRFIYRTELLRINKLRFNTTLPLSEDRIFNISALGCSNAIYYLRVPLYHYWINPGGAVGKYRNNMLDIIKNTHTLMSEEILRYWDSSYLPIYEKVNIVDGALLCVYNAFSHKVKIPFIQRYRNVRQVTDDETVRNAYEKLGKKNFRQKLIYKRRILLLCLIGIIFNIKNRK